VYGNNFATAGAIAIDEDGDPATPDINLPTQVGAYLQSRGGQAEADALHIVMIGGNDLFAAQDLYAELVWLGYRDAFERVDAAVESVKQQLQTLVATGAQNILVVNAPDIAETPQTDLKLEALLNPDTRTFKDIIAAWALGNGAKLRSKYTAAYNQGLAQAVADVEAASGIDIKEFDLSATFEYILDNATSLGYTNKDDACVYALSGQGFHPECNFDTFVFFDEIHPTAVTHERAAAALLQVAQD
jgi:phospholipase/lecithinase/hemolysin